MSDNVEVGRGLNRIFIGQLLVIVAMILATIPPAGLFAVVAAGSAHDGAVSGGPGG